MQHPDFMPLALAWAATVHMTLRQQFHWRKSNLCSPWFWLAAHFGHLWHTWPQITTWDSAKDLRSIHCCQHNHSGSQVISWYRCSILYTYSTYNLDSPTLSLLQSLGAADRCKWSGPPSLQYWWPEADGVMQSHCSHAYSHSHSIPLSSACQIEQAWRADAMPKFPVAPTQNSYAEVHYEISSRIIFIS